MGGLLHLVQRGRDWAWLRLHFSVPFTSRGWVLLFTVGLSVRLSVYRRIWSYLLRVKGKMFNCHLFHDDHNDNVDDAFRRRCLGHRTA